ncbi:hypothetical protein E8F11_14730 [Pseudomonas sp. BN417]|uniref:hypothetical protein n=1 Tax=Pseudomonas sp. BN417 TaxID=2567890 RepID=UPI0024546930|nr:hypothetical protein [Pseudomonas sp. BN417]MDH4556410.1 hypothetical protein [Pseudomonas sp. BN417]
MTPLFAYACLALSRLLVGGNIAVGKLVLSIALAVLSSKRPIYWRIRHERRLSPLLRQFVQPVGRPAALALPCRMKAARSLYE